MKQAILVVLAVVGCASPPAPITETVEATLPIDPPVMAQPVKESPKFIPIPGRLITNDRIGPAFIGGTIIQFKRELEGYQFEFVRDYVDGHSALCAFDRGEQLICAGIKKQTYAPPFADVEFLRTTHKRYRTAENIGVGTALSDGVAAYGPARLMYLRGNKYREFLTFKNEPKNLTFQPGLANKRPGQVGNYPALEDYASVTDSFRDDAMITAIEVRRR